MYFINPTHAATQRLAPGVNETLIDSVPNTSPGGAATR